MPKYGEVLTLDELAEYLQLSKSTLYKIAQAGKLPGQKIGKRWRFHKAAIDKWLKGRPEHLDNGKKTDSND